MNDYTPRCENCGVELGQDLIENPDTGETYCGLSCQAEHDADRQERKAEAAYDRFLENYYGGDSPATERERHVELWHEKQGLK